LSTIPRFANAWAGGVFDPSSPTICTPIFSVCSRGSSNDRIVKPLSLRVTNTYIDR
jgi:hypothetical protein